VNRELFCLFGNETRGSNRNVAIRFESMLDSQDDDRHQINHKLGLTLVCLASLNPLPLFALRRFNTNEAVPIEVFVPATSRIQGNRVNRGVYAKSLNTYRRLQMRTDASKASKQAQCKTRAFSRCL
jgi:hypothetical protein